MGSSTNRIGSDRQLFVDDLLIEDVRGAERVLHEPVREAPAIEGDRPWDLSPCAGGFMRDGDRFRPGIGASTTRGSSYSAAATTRCTRRARTGSIGKSPIWAGSRSTARRTTT